MLSNIVHNDTHIDAFPVSISGPDLNTSSNEVAIESLEIAFGINPNDKALVQALGQLHEQYGRIDRANFYYTRLQSMP